MNPRRIIAVLGACACLCLAGTQCSTPKVPDAPAVGAGVVDAELSYRTSPYWIRKATAVKARDWSVYFRGKADPPVEKSSATPWSGTISGEILVVMGKSTAMTCEGLIVRPDGRIEITTRSKTSVGLGLDEGQWQHLILP